MKNDLKLLCLVPIFGIAGAFATAIMWQIFDLALTDTIPAAYSLLGCVMVGLLGPVILGGMTWLTTSRGQAVRWPAAVGLGMVFATEVAFYVPLGFMVAAFHHMS